MTVSLPILTITGATADTLPMAGNLADGFILPTTNTSSDHLVQFAAGTHANEALQPTYFGLKLIATTVSPADLKAYYAAKPVPEPFLAYLNDAADGIKPFVYINGSTVKLVDAAKHDLLGGADVDMTVPDNFPLGTYTVQGMIKDLAGNETTVTLKLVVTGDRVAPVLTITGALDGTTPLAGTLVGGYTLPTLNVPANNHELHFAAGSISSEPLDGKVGLYLDPTGMDIPALTAYYMARIPDGSPAEFLAYRAYLISALDGVTKPFAYITTDGSNNLVLHDAAQYDLASDLTVGMVIPDDYPLGTYIVNGTAKDAAGNATPVTLKLIVTGDRVAPTLTITGATDGNTPLGGDTRYGYMLPTLNVPANQPRTPFRRRLDLLANRWTARSACTSTRPAWISPP